MIKFYVRKKRGGEFYSGVHKSVIKIIDIINRQV